MAAGTVSGLARVPLGDATRRVNNSAPTMMLKPPKAQLHDSVVRPPHSQPYPHPQPSPAYAGGAPQQQKQPRRRAPTTRERTEFESKRISQISQDSAASSRSKEGYKRFVGPWQLGKTLGKGSSARVRLCRHRYTQQAAAVKIVNKRMAYMIPDTSLAALNKWDSGLPESIDGELRVPMAIEREVAILKLIDHPNIMKLYDIWENRSEIYLILEYVDGGDLFTFIVDNGPLSEDVVLGLFRQILSAISFCHSFNICHRDLKPENILITRRGHIKIADFGMAALHQTANHRLATFCGSPHYAAPELLSMKQYRGDQSDIWSLGVILYAMLTATLPFDHPNYEVMMQKTKKGAYFIPDFVSPEAKDLIQRMIRVNPNQRISLAEMWRHPIIRRYQHLDNLDDLGQLPDLRHELQNISIPSHQVDPQLMRQLRSMYHMSTEDQIKAYLSSNESNDFKACYWLLHNYREKQLEDFSPELSHSMSDYHHLKPSVWKKRVATCAFSQPRANGQGRSVSRFTVISNVAESEAETVQSYDPFRASRNLHPRGPPVHRAKVVVHGHALTGTAEEDDQPAGSPAPNRDEAHAISRRAKKWGSHRTSASLRQQSPRPSMSSLHSSRPGTSYGRVVLTRKRAVDFSSVRRQSTDRQRKRVTDGRRIGTGGTSSQSTLHPSVDDEGGTSPRRHPCESIKQVPLTVHVLKPKDPYQAIKEDLQIFTSNISKDCDDAFNSSMIGEVSFDQSEANADTPARDLNLMPFSLSAALPLPPGPMPQREWDCRPLPPLPQDLGTNASSVALGTKRQTDDGLGIRLSPITRHSTRRVVSAPAPSVAAQAHGTSHLSAIDEGSRLHPDPLCQRESDRPRIVSAPARQEDPTLMNGRTIRLVNMSPVQMPKPLNIWKKRDSAKATGRSQSMQTLPTAEVAASAPDLVAPGPLPGKRKLSTWFRKSSLSSEVAGSVPTTQADDAGSIRHVPAAGHERRRNESVSTLKSVSSKKKGFGLLFWRNRDEIPQMSIEYATNDDGSLSPDLAQDAQAKGRVSRLGHRNPDSGASDARTIEVKQNWLARLFRVKPATSHLCFSLSRKRTRQEIAILLREWRKYGMRDVQVDKDRNLVFARVGPENYLELKEVAFAAEIMTVVEHGRRNALSIVRLTQERGAASSFHKVVDTMRLVFDSRSLLVKDRRKAKMMTKTLNS